MAIIEVPTFKTWEEYAASKHMGISIIHDTRLGSEGFAIGFGWKDRVDNTSKSKKKASKAKKKARK